MAQVAAMREYGQAASGGKAHIVLEWKPNPKGYLIRRYRTACGKSGAAYWVYGEEIEDWRVCSACKATAS